MKNKMELKTGEEILSEYRSQEQNLSTFKSLGELIDEELEKAKSFPVEKLVSPKVATTINQFNLGDMVEISMNSEHYRDWVGEKFKVVAIELNKEDKLLYTIKDNFGLSDEWEENDLTKALE